MQPSRTQGAFSTTVDLAPDADGLPVTVVQGSSGKVPRALLISLLVGAMVGGLVAALLAARGVAVARIVLPAVLVVAGLGVLLLIAALAAATVTWEFGEDRVHCAREGLLGRREWSEPLSAYRGVLRRQEMRSAGKSRYMVYLVQLLHEGDKKRTVTLYQSMKKDDLRRKHEHYTRLFGLPALTETEDGIQERRPEDLDKTVRQLVAEGIVRVEFDPTVPPPGRRLALSVEGEALAVQVKGRAIGVWGWLLPLLMVGAGLVMGAVAFLPQPPLHLAYVAAGLVIAGALLAWALAGLREELRVSPAEVRKWWAWRGRPFAEHAVRADDVEEVVIAEPLGSQGTKTVQAVAEDETVHFGRSLNAAERRWVRDCIIAVISR